MHAAFYVLVEKNNSVPDEKTPVQRRQFEKKNVFLEHPNKNLALLVLSVNNFGNRF